MNYSIEGNIDFYGELLNSVCESTISSKADSENENNDLWVHSPIHINQDIVNQLQKMGNVHSIISPNLLHHLHLAKFIKYFPNIPVYGVDGIEKKQKNVSFQLLPINLWGADILSFNAPNKLNILNELMYLFFLYQFKVS